MTSGPLSPEPFSPETSADPSSLHGSSLTERAFGAVLFDLDGTLIDSIGAVERSWLTWAAEHGLAPEALLGFHGVPAAGVIAQLLPHLDTEAQAASMRRVEALEVADTEGIIVLPGAAEALDALVDGGAHVAIVTSCTDPLLEARLGATGLRRPKTVVTASMVERGKPHPDPFLLAAERLGVAPEDCLVVEDAVAGLQSARAAGLTGALAVLHTTPAEELEPWADLIVPGLDLVRFIVGDDHRVRVETVFAE
jgi:sugar-phosphatase